MFKIQFTLCLDPKTNTWKMAESSKLISHLNPGARHTQASRVLNKKNNNMLSSALSSAVFHENWTDWLIIKMSSSGNNSVKAAYHDT